jgi:hypothetical protein
MVINSVVEILCQTETVPEDLLFADPSRRVFQLIQSGYVEIVNGKNPLVATQVPAQGRYRLTSKGNQALESAAAKPYAAVGEVISSSMHADQGISVQCREAYQDMLDAETADCRIHRIQQSSSHEESDHTQEQVKAKKAALENMFSQTSSSS